VPVNENNLGIIEDGHVDGSADTSGKIVKASVGEVPKLVALQVGETQGEHPRLKIILLSSVSTDVTQSD
jgi:hypothetical protein